MDQDPTGPEEATTVEVISSDIDRQMRMLLYALFALVVLMAVFVVYTSWRLNQFEDDREQVLAKLDQQHQQVACVVAATRLYDIAAADLLANQSIPGNDTAYVEQLNAVRNKIAEADDLCLSGPISVPPPATLPPATAPATLPPATVPTITLPPATVPPALTTAPTTAGTGTTGP